MDVRFVNPFVQSIGHVFRTMVGTEVTVGKPALKGQSAATTDVSAIIGLSGDVSGSVVLCFQKDVAVPVASAFAGTQIDLDNPDFADALGELANMVAGNAKKDFHGFNVSISLPSVVVGEGHKVSASHVTPQLMIPCHCKFGTFTVEVSVEMESERKTKTAAAGAAAGAVS